MKTPTVRLEVLRPNCSSRKTLEKAALMYGGVPDIAFLRQGTAEGKHTVVRSGMIPKCACAQPLAMRKPVMTSSKQSSVPFSVHSERNPCATVCWCQIT